MKKEDHIILLHKKLTNVISKEESIVLEKWLESDINKKIAEEITAVWQAGGQYQTNFEPDTKKAFAKFKSKLVTENEPPVVKMNSRKRWVGIAASLVVLLAASFLINRLFFAKVELITAHTGASERQEVVLPDGSQVWLNEQSTLVYAKEFSKEKRSVRLEGEAFFKVTRNEEKPFYVNTPDGYVQVLGTSFNVKDYADAAAFEVFVNSGKVAFVPKGIHKKAILTVSKKASFNKENRHMSVETTTTKNTIYWKTGVLKFENNKLATVFKDVKTHYGVDIRVDDAAMLDCKFTGNFKHSSIDAIIKTLSVAFDFKVNKNDKTTITLIGGDCK